MNTDIFSHINWLAVLVSAVAYFILGALWYSKALFGSKWAVAVGIDMSNPDKGKGMATMMIATFVFILIACVGLAILVNRLELTVLLSGVKLGVLTGICFAGTAVAISFVYESRPLALYLIDCGYHLLGNIVAAVILVLWG